MTTCYAPPMSGSDNNLLQFIASTVETLRQRIDTMSEQMATKVDLANLRDDMEARMEAMRAEMATKAELAGVANDLSRVANNVSRLESSLDAKTTAIRGDIEQVHMRLDSIDRGVNNRIGQVEVDVSRIRSVVYLLVKDKPEMLRMLGQSSPRENRPQG